MPSLAVGHRTGPGVRTALQATVLAGIITGFALLTAAIIVFAPELLRLQAFLVVSLALVALVLSDPRVGLLATIGYLIVQQFLRRVLIADAGWTSLDPLVLVGPLVVFVFVIQQFVLRKRPLAPDRLSLLVLLVLVLAIVEIPNPVGGGPVGGLGGFLYVGVPLLWFFVGREVVGPRLSMRLQTIILGTGVVIGIYGIAQTEFGYPAWDRAWFHATGYTSLRIGDEVRAFGTFASSAEYALFTGSALAIAACFALQRRTAAVLALPPLAIALFLSSGRAAVITAFFAIVVCCGVRTRNLRLALVVMVLSLGGTFAALTVFGSALSDSADDGGNSLVTHQVDGLTDPLNPQSSTLILHLEMVVEGIRSAATDHPLGRGTGASNQGANLAGGTADTESTEVDLSNAFVNLGLLGGFAYLTLFGAVLFTAVRCYFRGADHMLGVVGVLVVGAGQWLTGGHYALAPLTWILIGTVAATALRQARTKTEVIA